MDGAGDYQLKKVEAHDLPKLYTWLTDHLPETWTLWSSVRESMSGRWPWAKFYVLGGLPDNILAVGDGPPDETCPVYTYYTTPRNTRAFGISPIHVKTLLTWPGFMDWNKSFIFLEVPAIASEIALEKVNLKEGGHSLISRDQCLLMVAYPGDVKLCPVPEGLTLKPLDPDVHTDMVNSSWGYKRDHSDEYVRLLIQRFPSLGLFDREGKCLALELSNEYGLMGFLYVTPEARGRGLAKIISSHLANKLFSDNLPAAVTVLYENEVSLKLHESLGFKVKCTLDILISRLPHEFSFQ